VDDRAEVAGLGVDVTSVEGSNVVWGDRLPAERRAPGFPGVALLAAAAVGLTAVRRAAPAERRRTAALGLALVVTGFVLAAGTAPDGWRSWLPTGVLFDHVAAFRVVRAASRAWVLGLLGLGLLAGLGVAEVVERRPRPDRRWLGPAFALVVAGAVVVEGLVPWRDRPTLAVPPVDLELARRAEPGGVLYLPLLLQPGEPNEVGVAFGQALDVYATTAHHRPTPNGYSGLVPEELVARSRRMRALPDEATRAELRRLGVRFVVVRFDAAGTPWARLRDPDAAEPLELVGRFGGDVLYRLP
jgi:hypothetical protein